jgi:hypothetical protein
MVALASPNAHGSFELNCSAAPSYNGIAVVTDAANARVWLSPAICRLNFRTILHRHTTPLVAEIGTIELLHEASHVGQWREGNRLTDPSKAYEHDAECRALAALPRVLAAEGYRPRFVDSTVAIATKRIAEEQSPYGGSCESVVLARADSARPPRAARILETLAGATTWTCPETPGGRLVVDRGVCSLKGRPEPGIETQAKAPSGLHMYGAKQRHWNWAHAAQLNVPLADARIWVENGDAMYLPGVWWRGTFLGQNPPWHHATAGVLDVPFYDLPPFNQGWTAHLEKGLFLHELGHAFDFADMTPAARTAFKALAQVDCSWWAKHCVTARRVSGPGVYVDVPPGEMFAEEYMACALGLSRRQVEDAAYTSYGWDPPDGAEPQMCALIRSAG